MLTGGTGGDLMAGGLGADTYVVESYDDTTNESTHQVATPCSPA